VSYTAQPASAHGVAVPLAIAS